MKISRRQFLQNSALVSGGILLNPYVNLIVDSVGQASRIAVGHYIKTTDASVKIIRAAAGELFQKTLTAYTNTASATDAWTKIFPGLRESDKIGIKINTINRSVSTHPEVVNCVTDSLVAFGINPSNIIIWDRMDVELKRAKYTINRGGKGVQCYGTNHDGAGIDESYTVKIGDKDLGVSSILSKEIDYLINMPVLKDHGNAGMTFSMKNHYGSIPLIDVLPRLRALTNAHHVHTNNCETQIPELNSDPLIREKTKLIIGDAILGIYDGGPSGTPQFAPNKIIISDDPVAADQLAMELIEKKRKEMGLSGVRERARYIELAAKNGLGQNNKEYLDILEVNLD